MKAGTLKYLFHAKMDWLNPKFRKLNLKGNNFVILFILLMNLIINLNPVNQYDENIL
jgi:hypothetical protein